MATHSSILAWKIPWTEEPGRLPSMGSQRIGHDSCVRLSKLTFTVILFFIFWRTSMLFFIVAVPIYIPINSVQGLPFLHTLSNTYYYISSFFCFLIITTVKAVNCYPIVVSIYTSLTISDVEHLFMYLLAMDIFLGKIFIHVLCPFKNFIIIFIFALELFEFLIYFPWWLRW